MKKCFMTRPQPTDFDILLVVIRLLVGGAFMFVGFGKIQNGFHWMGPDSAVPGFLQFLAAFSEFGGGLALILGLLTRFAMLGLASTMIGAIIFHVTNGDPYINPTGGASYNLATLYLLFALLFLINGPGRFSLDRKIFGVRSKAA